MSTGATSSSLAQDQRIDIRNGAELLVHEGKYAGAEEPLAIFDPFSEPIISEVGGKVRFQDIVLGTTLKEEINEDTGNIEKKITEFSLESLQPRIIIEDESGHELTGYYLPGGAYLNIEDGRR